MTVVRPNSIAGINSITVQTGQALNIHDASGNLIRNITSSSGVSTFSSLHVGAGTTTSTQGISVGTGCSIVSTTVNQLELYTNSSQRLKITSGGLITQSNTWTNTYSATDTTHCGYQVHNLSDTTNTYAALRLTAGSSSPATAQIASVRTGTGSNDITFQVEASNTAKEALRIKSTGDVLIGGLLSDRGPALTVETNTYDGIGVYRNSADASTSLFTLAKSRGTSAGAVTVVNSGDKVGRIRFQGADGDELSDAAYIDCDIDATPGNNDMPGRLIFATSADGANSPTERLRIDSSGKLSTGAESSPDVSAGGLCLNQGAVDTNIVSLKSSDIAHGVTTLDETDTYFSIKKSSGDKGGARIHAFTDAAGSDPAFEIYGIINSDADQGYCPIELKGAEANGTGVQNIAADRRIVQIKNSDGTRIASFTGTGLTFGDDSAAANALNDYEEGIVTWASTNNGDISFNSSYKGRYTKIGELVTVSGYILIDSYTSSNTAIQVTMPFTSAANSEGYYTRGVGATFNKNMNFPSNYENMVAYVGGGESYMRFYMSRQQGGSADWHQMRASDFTSTTGIYFSVCYTTTA